MSGGRLIPEALAAQIVELVRQTPTIRGVLIHPDDLTWEGKLKLAIERQSIRNRLRRRVAAIRYVVADMPRRLRNARAALAGEWEADDE